MILLAVIQSLAMAHAAEPSRAPSNLQMQQQFRQSQRVQSQLQLNQMFQDINSKNQQKSEIETQLGQLKAPESLARQLRMNSKSNQFAKLEVEMRNQLQQLKIDIQGLKANQAALLAELK